MKASVQFYRKVLGMELIYGGEHASFSSLRASNSGSAILNLELGVAVPQWGRLIFHVSDVDALWTHLREKGFDPEIPRATRGASVISTCSIRMATSCHLLGRCKDTDSRVAPAAMSIKADSGHFA
jgi:hypothetical protein